MQFNLTVTKLIAHILAFSILYKWGLHLILSFVIIIYNIAAAAYIKKRQHVYTKRYTRKQYKMQPKFLLIYNIIELVLVCFNYAALIKAMDFTFGHYVVCVLHVLIVFVVDFFLMYNKSVNLPLKKKKTTLRRTFECGMMKDIHVVDGKIVLEEGERVQLLERVNGSVMVRKGNGEEYFIDRSIIDFV